MIVYSGARNFYDLLKMYKLMGYRSTKILIDFLNNFISVDYPLLVWALFFLFV